MEISVCPKCGAPAEIVNDGALPSSQGSIEHVRVWCARRHWFLTARDLLPVEPMMVTEG
jgi:hypothetical protein